MRALMLVASAALVLASCKDKAAIENAAVIGDNVAGEAIIANDTTAIDAATSDASNMAADVAFEPEESNSLSENGSADRPSGRRPRRNPSQRTEQPAREGEPDAPMESATSNET